MPKNVVKIAADFVCAPPTKECFRLRRLRHKEAMCDGCRADYEGNEPKNCKIYEKYGDCKFI